MLKCYFHPEQEATHTDSVVDLYSPSNVGQMWMHEVHYRRVPICFGCASERKRINTSRIIELSSEAGVGEERTG